MDPQVSQTVFAAITAVATVVWLVGLQFLLTSSRQGRAGPQQVPAEEAGAGEGREGWLSGSAEVDGDASTLASRAATILAKGAFGPVKILEKTDDRVRFERVEAGLGRQPAGHWFRRGELRFAPLRSGRTRVEWAAEPAGMRALLGLGAAFQAAGLLALVVGGWAVYTYFATSPDPALRGQTFQMLQVGHLLWPPFLFGALYRRGSRAAAAQLEALANNLPYHAG